MRFILSTMHRKKLKHFAYETARGFNLPPDLVAAIVAVESGWDEFAVRFEPAFMRRYLSGRIQVYGAVSSETERVMASTSFGLMQIMGIVARENGFQRPFLTELLDPQINLEFGCMHLRSKCDRYFERLGWRAVIASYNSGSPAYVTDGPERRLKNKKYVDKVMDRWGRITEMGGIV